MSSKGAWHGRRFYFGLHYDLHAGETDTELGTRCGIKELAPMLKWMNPDFVQTDCKGHPGYTSWFSQIETASVPPGLRKDALKQWRTATRELGLPLHCHYSGIWDRAAGKKYPHWCVVGPDGKAGGGAGREKMCPLGPYLEKLMIPQLLELIDRYEVDGFWIDGDIWAVEPCYCKRCRAAFEKATGMAEPPVDPEDPGWPRWWNFTRENYEAYVRRYCDAIHQHKAGVLVCSNWLQTFRNPGAPKVPTDWISGDNHYVFGLDGSRCEARFLSTRGKPWDIMLWGFYNSHRHGDPASPWTAKPPQMLMQEAAVLLAFGGNVQVYENPGGVRDGRLVPWRQQRLREVGRFVKKRRGVCQGTETLPQIAVLHSEHHLRATVRGKNLLHSGDVAPVAGAVYALLENHYGVDVLDEWALLPRLGEFPAVVAPERNAMSDEMVSALKTYVSQGGKLILSGADAFERFGATFLGASRGKVVEEATFHVPAGDGSVPLFSKKWRLIKAKAAEAVGYLGRKPLLGDQRLPNPAALIHRSGKGRVAYVPAALFLDFEHNRYPLTRAFVGELARRTFGRLPIEVKAPLCVDVALRRKGGRTIIHLINRISGIPNQPHNGAVDEIPAVGPIRIQIDRAAAPASVRAALEKGEVAWIHKRGRLVVDLSQVQIHEAIVVT